MKKIIISVMTAALLTVSCQKEVSVNTSSNSDAVEFTAYIDVDDKASEPGSKTIFDDSGKKSLWAGIEQIWILNGDSSNPGWKKAYATTLSSPSATATFKEEDATIPLTGTNFMALYPAGPAGNASWDGTNDVKNMFLNPVQKDSIKASYDPQAHIAIAQTTDNTLAFKNVVSFFKFTVGSDNITQVSIYGNAQEKISGNFNVSWNNGDPIVNGATETYAKIVAPEGQTLSKGATYYIAVLPTTFAKGFTVEVVSHLVTGEPKTTTKSYNLTRNKIVNLGELVYTTPKTRTLYLKLNHWDLYDRRQKFDAWILRTHAGDIPKNMWVDFKQIGNSDYYETQIPGNVEQLEIFNRDAYGHSHTEDRDRVYDTRKVLGIPTNYNCVGISEPNYYLAIYPPK